VDGQADGQAGGQVDTHGARAEQFESHRERLTAVAARVVGNRADAEDVVQEAWLRLARQAEGTVDNVGGWLTTVVGRLSIDLIRSRAAKAEVSFDDPNRLPVVTEDTGGGHGPEDQALEAESVGLALLVVLNSLRPEERLAFVLHDLFGVPFDEVAAVIGKSPDAAKMCASRARRKVQGSRPVDRLGPERAVVDAFLSAAREGDFDALLAVLDPDLTWEVHGPRGRRAERGRSDVLRAVRRGRRADVTARRVLVDGRPGILACGPTGRALAVMTCVVEDGRMTRIVSLTDPERLASLDLPDPAGRS
jgi:RNA polymerase sigma-70 factor (ECF subfamily)